MSERLPYEEMDQRFNNLPLPDEHASWQKMKKMLDEDDDEIIPPPVFLKSCLGWGILLLTGLVVAWLIVRPGKWWSETAEPKQRSSQSKTQRQIVRENTKTNTVTVSGQTSNKTEKVEKRNIPSINKIDKTNTVSFPKKKKETNGPAKSPITKMFKEKNSLPAPVLITGKNQQAQKQKSKPASRKEITVQDVVTKSPNQELSSPKEQNKKPDSSVTDTQQQTPTAKDSSKQENNIRIPDSTNKKKTKASQKKLFLTAGIGEQQLIPIAGQTAVPYSKYGRKGSLSDYVPSVFVQLQKEKKWFVQTEFRFGAAQSVKEFSYNRQTRYDTLSQNVTTTTMRLKKTYYHQLPVSFNYYLVPNLSLGIGGMYSRFYGAITEKETNTFNVLNQTITSFKQIIPVKHFTDSFLYKTQVHALVQADYQWRKFSFGLRYTKDIQPYIKYTKPDGTVDEEKNQSLQFMVRYRLWQSKKL